MKQTFSSSFLGLFFFFEISPRLSSSDNPPPSPLVLSHPPSWRCKSGSSDRCCTATRMVRDRCKCQGKFYLFLSTGFIGDLFVSRVPATVNQAGLSVRTRATSDIGPGSRDLLVDDDIDSKVWEDDGTIPSAFKKSTTGARIAHASRSKIVDGHFWEISYNLNKIFINRNWLN